MKTLTLCAVLFLSAAGSARAQFSNFPTDRQRLLLELNSGYYNVSSVGQINIDSSLIAAGSYLKMSRTPVILEGFEKEFAKQDIDWIDRHDPESPKRALGRLKGNNHLKTLLLIGAYYAFQSGKITIDADSALSYLFKAKRESETLHSTFWVNQTEILIAKAYLKQNNIIQGSYFTNLVVQNSKSHQDLRTQAKADYYYATYCPFIPELTTERISKLDTSSHYAFPNNLRGEIMVSMWLSDDTVTLQIKDNGTGLPADFDNDKKSLGMNLVKGLTNQLKGMFEIANNQGVRITVEFKIDHVSILQASPA